MVHFVRARLRRNGRDRIGDIGFKVLYDSNIIIKIHEIAQSQSITIVAEDFTEILDVGVTANRNRLIGFSFSISSLAFHPKILEHIKLMIVTSSHNSQFSIITKTNTLQKTLTKSNQTN